MQIKLSTLHYKRWRQALAYYRGKTEKVAKKEIIRIRFGGYPQSDIPWLRKLSDEVSRATDALLALDGNAWLRAKYEGRRNPRFSRLAAWLSFHGYNKLTKIVDKMVTLESEVQAK